MKQNESATGIYVVPILTLAFQKDGAAFFSGSTPHSAPCLLCYFPHLRSSLGHETVRFALGALLKSLLACGVPQESFNPRARQNLGPHKWGNPKKGKCQRMFKLLHNCTHLTH